MPVSSQDNEYLHRKLPIDTDETIIGIYRHHWFAYIVSLLMGGVIIIAVSALAILLVAAGDGGFININDHLDVVIATLTIFFVLVMLGSAVPTYLRMQEQLVLTNESLLQIVRPSVFTNRIDDVNLDRVDNVSVKQDFFGTMFGYGHISIETPGEQDNYEFFILSNPHAITREITNAAENYKLAVQSGKLPSSVNANQPPAQPQSIAVDAQEYRDFLQYQKAKTDPVQSAPAQQPATEQTAEYLVPDGQPESIEAANKVK